MHNFYFIKYFVSSISEGFIIILDDNLIYSCFKINQFT